MTKHDQRWAFPILLVQLIFLMMMMIPAEANFFLGDVFGNYVPTKGYHNNTMESVGRGGFVITELDMEKEGWWRDHPAYHRMLSISAACESATTQLNDRASLSNEFQIIRDFAVDVEANRKCDQFAVSQENTKLVCTVDFGNAVHDLQNICSNVYGAIYSESNYTYRCDKNNDLDFLVYNELNWPMCVATVCGQTGWRSYQVAGADQIGSWLQNQGYPDSTCERLRLNPQFATLPDSIPTTCSADTDNIMATVDTATPGLASHRSTQAISCTNQANGFQCSIDFSLFDHGFEAQCRDNTSGRGIYIEVDYSLSCTKSGSSLTLRVTNDPFCPSQILCTASEYPIEAAKVRPPSMITLLATEGYSCTYNSDLAFEDFKRSLTPTMSAAPSVSAAPSLVPSVSNNPSVSLAPSDLPSLQGCSGASSDLMTQNQVVRQALETIQTQIDAQPSTNYCTNTDGQVFCDYDYTPIVHTLETDCKDQGGTYVEHTFEIICTKPATGEETVTQHIDRPFCLDQRCEYVEMNDFIVQHYQSDIPPADTLCISYTLQELLVGGKADVPAIPVSAGCQFEANQMSSTTAILNAKALIRSDYENFGSKEIRNYCPSKQPGFLDCDFDFSSSILAITNNLRSDCPSNGGQYLTSAFTVVCNDPIDQVEVTFKVRNVPGCVGYCCEPGESKTIMDAEHTWFTDYYVIDRGWTCGSMTITTLSTPNFNVDSACVTPAPGVVPTLAPVVNQADDGDCTDHPVWGCYKGLVHPLFDNVLTPQVVPTFAPTPTALHFENFVNPSPGSNPTGSSSANDNVATSADEGGLSGGAIAGIIIGVLILLCAMCYLLFRAVQDKREKEDIERDGEQSEVDFRDPENQDRRRTFSDEDAYPDPDYESSTGPHHDDQSYDTRDWEGDESQYPNENASTDEYTEGYDDSRDSRFSIDEDEGGDYDSSAYENDGEYTEDDDEYTEDSDRRYR
mmetsp:Transcript_44766/g.108143  ORF Transcript_44766/g.108143 Transcript_44766/m.108143 type:complete len:964 (+) Transcript_44766:111-3002(+)